MGSCFVKPYMHSNIQNCWNVFGDMNNYAVEVWADILFKLWQIMQQTTKFGLNVKGKEEKPLLDTLWCTLCWLNVGWLCEEDLNLLEDNSKKNTTYIQELL